MDLSPFIRTKSQATDFSERLASITQSVYQTGFSLEKMAMKHFGLKKTDLLLRLFQENNVAIDSPSQVKEFLEKIRQTVSTLPVLSLTLAFEPTEQTLLVLSQWFMMQLKKQVLFDLTVDPSLLAGVAISYNGKYLDFSIKPRFEKILQASLAPAPAKQEPQVTPIPEKHEQNPAEMHIGR